MIRMMLCGNVYNCFEGSTARIFSISYISDWLKVVGCSCFVCFSDENDRHMLLSVDSCFFVLRF